MKKICLLIIFIMFAILHLSWGGENKMAYDASKCAVDNIIRYYSAMTKLKEIDQAKEMDYQARLSFYKKNRALMIQKIAQVDASYDLGRVHQICENLYEKSQRHLGYTTRQQRAGADAYFDSQTGHQYVKQEDNTYAEFTQKGIFVKLVPSDLPLLNQSPNIHPIMKDSYILYEKYSDGKFIYQSLPGNTSHPKGWKAKKLLVSLK